MEAALVSVSTGVMKPLLSKLTTLLEEEWVKFKGVRKQIRFLRDELSAMSATLEMLADAEQLNPEMRLWRDKLRELAYDLEDCIDGFMARVDHGQDGCKGFKKYYRKLKRFIARHEIANQIEELKASVMEASERHKMYKSFEIASNSSTYCAVDPRLSALYVEIDQLIGIDGPMKYIIECLTMENKASSSELKVLSIVGCGGLGKTTLANQVYKSVRSQFSCAAFVSVSRNPDVKKILRDIAEEVGIKDNMLYHDEKKLIDNLREHLLEKRVLNDIGSTLAKNPGAERMIAILSMSYFDIPHRLRTCLLYLSMFPEDYVIKKQRLINRWIAEGFIHEDLGRTRYEVGESYFNDLINRSMIQPVDVKYGQAKACQVHDIILDYIKCKAAEENFVTSLDAVEHAYTSEYKVRRLCVNNHTEANVAIWTDPMLSQVRSVTIFGQSVKASLLPNTALRVLDCWVMKDHHLASIENLFHLKYLRLSSGSITELPEKIGELRYLQTLDVRATSIKELPSTITKLQRLAHLYVDDDVRLPDGTIGQMHSLEEVSEYGIDSYEQGKSLQEFNKLTKLRTLKIKWDFGSEALTQVEGCHSCVGTLLSSCNLYNLDIVDSSDNFYPLSLDSWHPATPCSLQKLCMKNCTIYKVPNWMCSLGNLVVLQLTIICLRPEDVEILGEIPSLLFLELGTFGGTTGRIIVHGSNGFRSLKYFSLRICYCGTALEFQVGSMPNLDHVKLTFPVHKRECLNGASSLGIQHLSALSKVEIEILGECVYDSNYNPTEDKNDGAVTFVASAINGAIMTHPNRPTVRFETEKEKHCEHFECALRKCNQDNGGVLTEWLKILQIDEVQSKQEVPKDDTYEEEEEVEQMRNDEKGVEQHEGECSSSNHNGIELVPPPSGCTQ